MRQLLFVLLLIPIFVTPGHAQSLYEQAGQEFGAAALEESLGEEERAISGSLSLDGSYDSGAALSRLWRELIERLRTELEESMGFAAALLAVVLLCSMAVVLSGSEKLGEYIEICGVCAAAAILLNGADGLLSQTTQAMYRLSDYSKAALPVVFTAAAAGGAVGSAGAKYAAVSFGLDVLMSLSQKVIIPLIYAYLGVSLANAVFPNAILGAAARLTKWTATTAMTGMTIAFTAYVGMTGLISSSLDASAIKAARAVISSALPVVGGLISDASATVLSAAGVIRNCAGVFGLVAVCAMCAGPFAFLTVKTLLLKAVAAVADSVQSRRLSGLFSAIGGAAAMLMGLLGCCGIMLFVSFTTAMKAVTA